MRTILVTGANGQLGTCIKNCTLNETIIFVSSSQVDITNNEELSSFFKKNKIDWCINCAAFTAVDKAETAIVEAAAVNTIGAQNLAQICHEHGVILIHVSTDFVFDGKASIAYDELHVTNPLSVYGLTKLKGEKAIAKYCPRHFIIRTSWLYSEYGQNFMKTMLRFSEERNELNIVSDQIGSPTYALDLAQLILKITKGESHAFGIYNYSNEGIASWYDFATAIFELAKKDVKTIPIKSEAYPTPAKRPHFSVLDKTKIKKTFQVEIPHWRISLKKALINYDK